MQTDTQDKKTIEKMIVGLSKVSSLFDELIGHSDRYDDIEKRLDKTIALVRKEQDNNAN